EITCPVHEISNITKIRIPNAKQGRRIRIFLFVLLKLRQHRTIPALRLKHRSGGCGTASALPKCSIRLQYYLRFWLSSCRTSLAVSALRIMQYCPWFFIQTGKRFVPRALTSLFRGELSLNFKRTNRKIRILLPCLAFGIRIFVILLISCTGHVISVQKSL
ncbi:MAG: hypothetical protein WAS53_00040, partial [Gemmiger qucibialis]